MLRSARKDKVLCPYARMPVCPYARMPVCPYARMPVCPTAAACALGLASLAAGRPGPRNRWRCCRR
ncbi:MAG: hypothetical protein GEU75_00830 [Dehalococcoidia bacterium]|nr:hypothetical protein [Dehalococcoidia bacterium]